MSVDKLQEKIRKTKNPTVLEFSVLKEHVPAYLVEEFGNWTDAYECFVKELLGGLKGIVPAVRFSFSAFALMGEKGLSLLREVLAFASALEYYVILDVPEALSAQAAQIGVQTFLESNTYPCDGIVLSSYIGSDGLKPYAEKLKTSGKALFVVIRTANKSAPELQDLMTGSRLVHTALADMAGRMGEPLLGKCGYCQVAGVAAASSADSLRNLRAKQKYMFLLLDGYDYPNANAKNCSFAFDRLGHGAVACAGNSVTAAWYHEQRDQRDFVTVATEAAERMKKNLTRYISIL